MEIVSWRRPVQLRFCWRNSRGAGSVEQGRARCARSNRGGGPCRWLTVVSFQVFSRLSLAFGLIAGGRAARSGDPLENAKRRREIAVQQIESDVRDALREANELARSSPQKAIAKLKQLIATLDDDTALSSTRDTLKAMVKGRIRDLEADAARRNSRGVDDADNAARTIQHRTAADRRADDTANLSRGLQDVQSLRSAGRNTEANQLQSDLARRYPDSAAAAASRIINERAGYVGEARRTRTEVSAPASAA